jgi:hypothetical protein
MGNGKWEMGNGKWEMGNGKWEMGNGKWEMDIIFFMLYQRCKYNTSAKNIIFILKFTAIVGMQPRPGSYKRVQSTLFGFLC